MRGINGLTLIVFGFMVWFARWAGIGTFRDLEPRVIQAIEILVVFGLAMVVMGLIRRFWGFIVNVVREP
jgi:hypothetical protein